MKIFAFFANIVFLIEKVGGETGNKENKGYLNLLNENNILKQAFYFNYFRYLFSNPFHIIQLAYKCC